MMLSILLVLVVAVVLVEVILIHPTSADASPSSATLPQALSEDPSEPTEPSTQPAETAAPTQAPTQEVEPTEAPKQWELTLVNADNPLHSEDIPTDLTTLRNDVQVDSRIYPALQQMFDDAREQGIYPLVNEGFRTSKRQQEILDQYIADYVAQGYDAEEAKNLALKTVCLPGTSEHELGLALDIIGDEETADANVYAWLAENAWDYGFILRYPDGKEDITGISYEPWHYRYVGVEAAKQMQASGETLEEYLQHE